MWMSLTTPRDNNKFLTLNMMCTGAIACLGTEEGLQTNLHSLSRMQSASRLRAGTGVWEEIRYWDLILEMSWRGGTHRCIDLEHDSFILKHSGVSEVFGALCWGEAIEELSDLPPGGFDGSSGGLAEQGLELGEDLLDRVEVGVVGGQEEEFGAGSADGVADGLALVRSQIVHDDDVARREFGRQTLFDIG
jgi:hypothetical protein